MCGIAAIIEARPGLTDSAIDRMTASLSHRGPDAFATIDARGARIGHRRLSIIDLGGGAQPMGDPTERFWITFNGEIYNFRELRATLEGLGRTFRTHSDTEVLLEAYLAFGDKTPEHLNGQYAFAIWDTQERKLFAARDRLGEKPLYWATSDDGHFLIASEIKSLLASGLIRPKLDPVAVDAYLTLLYVPPDRTIYQNIHTLLPAHAMTWQDGKQRVWNYWQPRYSTGAIKDPREAVAEVSRLIEQAVHRQMVADVPVGAFLSGGLDSTTIVACMSRHSLGPVQTFSVGFEDLIDELPYARLVAELYRTDHHELQMSMPLGELLDEMVTVYDEPFADSSNIPTYMVAQYARRSVKVVLSGDGGDELFGGYHWNAPRLQDLKTMQSPPSLLPLGGKALAWRVLAKLSSRFNSRRHRAVTLYNNAKELRGRPDLWDRHVSDQSFFSAGERRKLWGGRPVAEMHDLLRNNFAAVPSAREMDRVVDYDLRCYLPGDILVKVDRASMALGLETRAPFLDVDLVEFTLGLPWQMRFTEGQSKPILRQACEHLWPAEIRGRSKQGFGAPVNAWMKRPEVRAKYDKAFRRGGQLESLLPGLAASAPRLRPYQEWTLMCLGLWLEKHA